MIEHRLLDKHQSADSPSKNAKIHDQSEEKQANQAKVREGFSFVENDTYKALPLTRWLGN